MCRPCAKAKLACAYELPPGQTRAQALMESQQRLRDELHSHASLVHFLRVVDANTSIQMLSRLRHGDYDRALLGTDLATRTNSSGDKIFPWEEQMEGRQHQRAHDANQLPPVDAFPPVRHDGALYPLPRSTIDKPSLPYESAAASPHGYPANFEGPHGMHASHPMIEGSTLAPYQPYQHPDMQAQLRRPSSFQQQDDMSHMSTLPSNDPNRTYPGPQ